jgi:hypothetical protein
MFKLSVGDYIVWGVFGSILCYAFLHKWGILGGYLQASPYVYFGLALYLTIKFSERIDEFFLEKFSSLYFTWLFKVCKGLLVFFIFFSVIYVAFFSTMDRLLISKISGVPIQVLLPCSYRPIPPELEQDIRKVWRINGIESIDSFCGSEIHTNSSSD